MYFMKFNKKTYVAVFLISFFLLLFITIVTNKTNDSSDEKEKKFPDHSVLNEGFDTDYPAPVKQLQQVLSHSYVNEPKDDALKIDVDLSSLKFESSPELINGELDTLQQEINELRKAMDRTANE